ncbi:MAG: rod shape-determining protein MreD [Thermoleophilia bacterium]|nr:rod shape-determining protein MreD [Thermoleophilia bacterium]
MIAAWLADKGRLALALVAAVAFQTVVTSQLPILGVTADLFLLLTVLVAISRGATVGLVFGFVAGLTADIVFLDPVGLRTFIYLIVGYGVGWYVEEFGLPSAWMVVVLAGVTSLLSQGVYGIFQFIMGSAGGFMAMTRLQVLPAALVDGLLAAPLYVGLVRLRILPRPDAADPSFR